jgi:hypothetical protein
MHSRLEQVPRYLLQDRDGIFGQIGPVVAVRQIGGLRHRYERRLAASTGGRREISQEASLPIFVTY